MYLGFKKFDKNDPYPYIYCQNSKIDMSITNWKFNFKEDIKRAILNIIKHKMFREKIELSISKFMRENLDKMFTKNINSRIK